MIPILILGVDPGINGAVALLDTRSVLHPLTVVYDLPTRRSSKKAHLTVDAEALASLIRSLPVAKLQTVAVVEQVSSLPHQAGAFNFGLSTGIIHGVLGSLGIPTTLVPPSQWKPAMGLGRLMPTETQASTKTRARELATKLFPHLHTSFNRVKDDGRAEALLLAYYHSIQLEKGTPS